FDAESVVVRRADARDDLDRAVGGIAPRTAGRFAGDVVRTGTQQRLVPTVHLLQVVAGAAQVPDLEHQGVGYLALDVQHPLLDVRRVTIRLIGEGVQAV